MWNSQRRAARWCLPIQQSLSSLLLLAGLHAACRHPPCWPWIMEIVSSSSISRYIQQPNRFVDLLFSRPIDRGKNSPCLFSLILLFVPIALSWSLESSCLLKLKTFSSFKFKIAKETKRKQSLHDRASSMKFAAAALLYGLHLLFFFHYSAAWLHFGTMCTLLMHHLQTE